MTIQQKLQDAGYKVEEIMEGCPTLLVTHPRTALFYVGSVEDLEKEFAVL